MTNERWQEIERLYQATLQQSESRRADFLREQCGSDEELRVGVETLLARHDSVTGPLLETPPTRTLQRSGSPVGQRSTGKPSTNSLIGHQIGSYEILAPLGSGGMGEVYSARDRKLERQVAVKILPQNVAHDADRLSRFRREAQLLAALNHPNIATIHGLEESGDLQCLVMELVPGHTLAERLAGGALPAEEALRIAVQITEALDAAHKVGITHRDIKPANIKVTPEGRVKILDFGLAKSFAREGSAGGTPSGAANLAVTRAGMILGTPGYMSPEQVRGEPVDHRADIWAFGCVLFEMLSGKRPFPAPSVADFIARVLTAEPDWSALPAATPAGVRGILNKCLERDPSLRAQDIVKVLEALKAPERAPTSAETHMAAETVQSIAVLPFVNASGDPQMDYLSDGLTESIIFSLSQLPQLRVLARSTVFRHKGRDADVQKIGRKLKVNAVVSGRVLQRDDVLSISAGLIDVTNGWQIWGAQYRRKAQDILATEEEIAREISQKLRLKLAPEKQAHLTHRPTNDVEAYHLYLKGRFCWGKRTEEGLFQALQYFREAIAKDPTYAQAYAGLAEGYIPLAFYAHLAPKDAVPKAQAAAKRALEIDPELPEAHTVVGSTRMVYDWNLAGAEQELRAAISQDPDYPRAHQALAECLSLQGKFNEAMTEVRRAVDLDPLSLHLNAAVVMTYHFCGGSKEAVEWGRKAIELEPTFFPTHFYTGLAYQACGKFVEAVSELRQAAALSANSTLMRSALSCALATAGEVEEARKLLQELLNLGPQKYVAQSFIAAIYAALGEKENALASLEKAFDERCVWLSRALALDPRVVDLRGESRFQQLLQRMKFPR